MKIAILSANLGNFDRPLEPVKQKLMNSDYVVDYHCFTDEDFPPITGLTPRLQYRLPKYFGWQMYPGYDYYIWLDASMSLQDSESAWYFLRQCLGKDMVVFKHPWRKTIKEESEHIEEYLKKGNKYITSRYKNGLHKEQLADIYLDKDYVDDHLYASNVFMYKDSEAVRDVLRLIWLHSSRYFTCDQLAFTYATKDLDVEVIKDSPFKSKFVTLASPHR